jgi:hypothetical protein
MSRNKCFRQVRLSHVLRSISNCDVFIYSPSYIYSMMRGWSKLYNKELHNLDYWPNVIRMIMSKRMRWAGRVTGMVRRGLQRGALWASQKERNR